MNTVFKLYYQAWLIAGVAAGAGALPAGEIAAVRAIQGALGTITAGATSGEHAQSSLRSPGQ